MTTVPAEEQEQESVADHIVVAPFYKDNVTGALYVHRDLEPRQAAWADEAHVSPANADERFGDVESFAEYLKRYVAPAGPFLSLGMAAGFMQSWDYHSIEKAGRCAWRATYPFVLTKEWLEWMTLANGAAYPHAKVIEFLEDHAEDIDQPDTLELMTLLRTLRGIANSEVETTVRQDGTGRVESMVDRKVSVELPAEIRIALQALKGHNRTIDVPSGPVEVPVKQELTVRVRVSVDANARLTFRFSIPSAERQLERVFMERVKQARELLPDYQVLRAAD